MSAPLALKEGGRHVRVASWSNDLRKLAVLVGEYMDLTPPFRRTAEDLVVIDVYDGSAWYVATAYPHAWLSGYYNWKMQCDGYAMYAPPDGDRSDFSVYRKSASELPNGMRVQRR